jgi:TonB family protein
LSSEHRDKRQTLGGFGISLLLHGAVVGIILTILAFTPKETLDNLQRQVVHLVYLQDPGPGGGGGGSPAPAPKQKLEIPEHKAPDPVPVITPPVEVPPPPPIPVLNAPVMTPNAQVLRASGLSSVSLAPGGGEGRGSGVGSGRGSGVGEGTGGGFGGGAFQPGNGISIPVVLRKVNPTYTSEAMRAKVQGTAIVEAVVLPDGTMGDVRIVRSLDRVYGLDAEALKAAKAWLFRPGVNREGQPVPVRITIELAFNLH